MPSVSKIALGGQVSGSGSWADTGNNTNDFATNNAMFLKVFAGEVLTAFMEKNVMMPLTRVRTISSGKSAQFPLTGKATAGYHVPGRDILEDNAADDTTPLLSNIQAGERVIHIDETLTSNCFIDDLDEAKSHYDYRSPFSRELGHALAYKTDKNLIKMWFNAATDTGNSNPLLDGIGAVNLGAITTAAVTTANMVSAFYDAAQKMDENDVPESGRFAVLEPELYYRLIQDAGTFSNVINVDYGGEGSAAAGRIVRIADITIYKANHIKDVRAESDPNHDGTGSAVSQENGDNNDYGGDFTTLGGIFGHEEAIGTVKLKDIALESDYILQRLGTLFVAKMAVGHGKLRADCAGYFALSV